MRKVIVMVVAALMVLMLSGCEALRVGTHIDVEIVKGHKVSADRLNEMAPIFKESWPYVSGFIRGSAYYEMRAPKIVKDSVQQLDVLYLKAVDGSWTPQERGKVGALLLQLDIAVRKYLYDEYGADIATLMARVVGV